MAMEAVVEFALSKIEKQFPALVDDVKIQELVKKGTPALVVGSIILILSWCCYCCCCQPGRKFRGLGGGARGQRRGRNVRYD